MTLSCKLRIGNSRSKYMTSVAQIRKEGEYHLEDADTVMKTKDYLQV